jgi:hypothetical protein
MILNEMEMAILKIHISKAEAEISQSTGLKVTLLPRLSSRDVSANLKVMFANMCNCWEVTLDYVSDKSRNNNRPMMRKLLWMAGRLQYPTASYSCLGQLTGISNHVTVLRGIKEGNNWLKVKDAKFMVYYELVKNYFDDQGNEQI